MLGRSLHKRLWIWRGWNAPNPIVGQRANLAGTAFITALALQSPQTLVSLDRSGSSKAACRSARQICRSLGLRKRDCASTIGVHRVGSYNAAEIGKTPALLH